ncbi:hypothetical protein MKZ17_04870 [Solibacillus sp. FSL R7-0682]|uniref:nucleotidyltransferase domain-containing protein n=1 Tax=Solibacillus sp. FSL R7-0682 TaxID=2921690 RepID=UPI0030F4EAEE
MSFIQCRNVTSIMTGFDKAWFIAGGWAIDLFIGEETRKHEDIEIAIFRKNQMNLKTYLKEWDIKKVIKGEFYHWGNEYLELPIHELLATNRITGEKIEILLNEIEGNNWVFRRDSRISYPHDLIFSYSETGIPYLKPEVVILYKAKNTRQKDHQDFLKIKDLLNIEKRQCLRTALELHAPKHKWIHYLL